MLRVLGGIGAVQLPGITTREMVTIGQYRQVRGIRTGFKTRFPADPASSSVTNPQLHPSQSRMEKSNFLYDRSYVLKTKILIKIFLKLKF